MIKVLYYLRLNAALILGLFLALPFLNENPGHRLPASEAPSGSCFHIMRESLERHGSFTPRGPAIKERIPNFEVKIQNIESRIITPKDFARTFKREKGRWPLIKEMVDFFESGHEALMREIQALEEGVGDDRELSYYVNETLNALEMSEKEQQNIITFKAENPQLLETTYDINDGEMVQKMEWLWKNPFGDYGELLVALKTPGVEVQNLHLRILPNQTISDNSRRHKEIVARALDIKFQELEGLPPAEVAAYKNRYPIVFTEARAQSLEDVRHWIESKEVDLVVNVEGRGHYFIEVKNYNREVDRSKIESGYRNKKSILEQQKEMVEIIHFLGLERKYIPAIHFVKGVNAEAKEVLEQNGVLVIEDI
ncbi:MAG: hypothetical protein VXV96_16110 [Bdellovibrionota bacterium]|nr:hypothetical protein [Bdellovibrionota bacterium]